MSKNKRRGRKAAQRKAAQRKLKRRPDTKNTTEPRGIRVLMPIGHDRHHIFYTKAIYYQCYAKKLRNIFIYPIPRYLHEQIHELLKEVPPPPNNLAYALFVEANKERNMLRKLDIISALDWAIERVLHEPTRQALLVQRNFLNKHRKEL